MPIVERMLELAGVGAEDVVYDLGCGDGRIVVSAADRYGARGVGVDLDPRRIQEAKRLAKRTGVESLVEFRVEEATTTDFSGATVLTLYLLPESNELLRPIMERRLAAGARVVSHEYEIPGWTPLHEETVLEDDGKKHYLFFYVMGRHTAPSTDDGATPRR
jgi:SAM-dependent methyltransferase